MEWGDTYLALVQWCGVKRTRKSAARKIRQLRLKALNVSLANKTSEANRL